MAGYSRKRFLKTMATGGLGLLVPTGILKAGWMDRGASLRAVSRQSLVMGSIVQFEAVASTEDEGYEAIRRAVRVFRQLEEQLSMYKGDSETSRLGKRSGREPMTIGGDTRKVLVRAKEVYAHSSGKFDITIEPAMRQWGFRKGPGNSVERPTDAELKRLHQLVGMDKLVLEGNEAQLQTAGMAIDVGGIGGGYALDKAIAAMQTTDAAAGFINFSGDLHSFGRPVGGRSWTARLVDPQTQRPLSKEIELNGRALSTSGSYQNRRRDGHGHSWGHLLSPALARPVEPVGSVTALHPSALEADAWSTATYVGAKAPSDVDIIRLG